MSLIAFNLGYMLVVSPAVTWLIVGQFRVAIWAWDATRATRGAMQARVKGFAVQPDEPPAELLIGDEHRQDDCSVDLADMALPLMETSCAAEKTHRAELGAETECTKVYDFERSCTKAGAIFFSLAVFFGTWNSICQKSVLEIYAEARDGNRHRFTTTPFVNVFEQFSLLVVATVALKLKERQPDRSGSHKEHQSPVTGALLRAVFPTAALEAFQSAMGLVSLRFLAVSHQVVFRAMVVVYTLILRYLWTRGAVSRLRLVGVGLIILSSLCMALGHTPDNSTNNHTHRLADHNKMLIGSIFVTISSICQAASFLWDQHLMTRPDEPISPNRLVQIKGGIGTVLDISLIVLMLVGFKLANGNSTIWIGQYPFTNIADGAFQLAHSTKLHVLLLVYMFTTGVSNVFVANAVRTLSAIWASLALPFRTVTVWCVMIGIGAGTSTMHHG